MIAFPSSVHVWLAVGRTEMRRGRNGLALQVQQALGRDPHAGDLYVFRGARGDLVKILWHDGIGMSLYAKRLEKGRFVSPTPADGVVGISASHLAYMLDGIDWRNPRLFSPAIWWSGSSVTRFGSDCQVLQMNSYGVRPLSVLSRRA